jgi:hypothetical protein
MNSVEILLSRDESHSFSKKYRLTDHQVDHFSVESDDGRLHLIRIKEATGLQGISAFEILLGDVVCKVLLKDGIWKTGY